MNPKQRLLNEISLERGASGMLITLSLDDEIMS